MVDEEDFCTKKNSYINCQCDRGYEMMKNVDNSISCTVKSNRTFEVMLNPRASFYLSHHGSTFAVKFLFDSVMSDRNLSFP